MLLHGFVETTFPDGTAALTTGQHWDEPEQGTRTGIDEVGSVNVFRRRVVAGLAAALRSTGARRVVVIPCRTLDVLPVHAMLCQEEPESRCLLDDVEVTFAPSAECDPCAGRSGGGAPRCWPGCPGTLPHARPLPLRRSRAGGQDFPGVLLSIEIGAVKQRLRFGRLGERVVPTVAR